MRLKQVLDMLALLGISSLEATQLLSQPTGWEQIQQRVKRNWQAFRPYMDDDCEAFDALLKTYDTILRLKLKSIHLSPEQEAREKREVADKLKNVGKPAGFDPSKAAEGLSSLMDGVLGRFSKK